LSQERKQIVESR